MVTKVVTEIQIVKKLCSVLLPVGTLPVPEGFSGRTPPCAVVDTAAAAAADPTLLCWRYAADAAVVGHATVVVVAVVRGGVQKLLAALMHLN